MLHRDVLAVVAGLMLTTAAAASETPGAELPAAPFASESPASLPLVPAASETPAPRLVWIDPASEALGTEAVVRPEVKRLLREMGVNASWRRGEPHEIAQVGELRVIFLNRAAERGHGVPVLGATPASFQGERFVWIHVPSVRASVGVGQRGPSLDMHAARQLGIALARVIAHEVIHALAPALPHGSGLMSARLDRRTLTAAKVAVDPQVGLALRAALLAKAPAAPPSETILAVESTYREPYR